MNKISMSATQYCQECGRRKARPQKSKGRIVGFDSALTRREREIAVLVGTGASNKEIARQLTISIKTVKNILTRVLAKTGTRSRTELAVRSVRSGFGTSTA
jgi:DNA-binding CsgD family transcriptional regulator